MKSKCKDMCRGCHDDFYNGNNNLGVKECWAFKKATVVRRWALGFWTQPTVPRAFREVEILSCYHESGSGKRVFERSLPHFAVDPIRLPKNGDR